MATHRSPVKHLVPRIALILIGLCAGGACGAPEQPPIKSRVFFLGIDGATWKVIGPLLEAGRLPAFRRLVEGGAYMPRFETTESTLSPIVWTTIATGRRPEDHGVHGFTEELSPGRPIPVTSNSRKAKAIWEIASDAGVSVGVVGWWATWPTDLVDGFMVTDHANPAYLEKLETVFDLSQPEEAAGRFERYHPADLGPTLREHMFSKEVFPFEDFQRRSGLRPAQMGRLRAAPWNARSPYSSLKSNYLLDYPKFELMKTLDRERRARLEMLYLGGPDPVQHHAWNLFEPDAFAKKPRHLERDRGLVESVYHFVDSFLGEILDSIEQDEGVDTWLIVASDHGAEASPHAGNPRSKKRPGEHSRRAKGVLFIHGPHVKKGYVIRDADPYDLMPTMAWLLDLPLSEELVGDPLVEAFEESFSNSKSLQKIAAYGPRSVTAASASPEDERMLQRLRTLGYID